MDLLVIWLLPAAVTSDELAVPVGTSEIIDGSVTSTDLGTDSVGTDATIDGSIGSDDIASNSIGADEIIDGSVKICCHKCGISYIFLTSR